MLRNTFIHIPGIGRTTERKLWDAGCSDWAELLENLPQVSCGSAAKSTVRQCLQRSEQALAEGRHQYFASTLRMSEAWRAFPEFRDRCVYLDIETDGSRENGVTMIGLYDGKDFTCLVQGEDLENFRDVISRYSMVVTFFGHGFDIPVLQRSFRGAAMDQIHFDLCPAFRHLGYRGGLKKIEKEFSIQRSPETDGLTGYDAVLLWRRYRLRGDESALQRLIAYNREDVVNLERLAEIAYEKLRALTFPTSPQMRLALTV